MFSSLCFRNPGWSKALCVFSSSGLVLSELPGGSRERDGWGGLSFFGAPWGDLWWEESFGSWALCEEIVRQALTSVIDSVTRAAGDCWGCNRIFHTDSYANSNMCSPFLMGHLQIQLAPFRTWHPCSGSLIANGFIVRV